jgi:hypothetical protein
MITWAEKYRWLKVRLRLSMTRQAVALPPSRNTAHESGIYHERVERTSERFTRLSLGPRPRPVFPRPPMFAN